MNRYLFLFFALFLIKYGTAQKISGYIKNENGDAISSALVRLRLHSTSVVSDEKGFFRLNLPPNGDTLEISHVNYITLFQPVEVSSYYHEYRLISKENILATADIIANRVNRSAAIVHSTLNAEDILSKSSVQDLPYILQSLPSTAVTSDAGNGIGYTNIRIRGLDPTQINILINGVPLNDAESQSVYWVDLPDLIASASEIQIQRGIGSSGAGQVAFGSTILVNTNKYNPLPSAVLELGIGSFNTVKTNLQLGTGLLKNKWNLSIRGSYIHSDGFVDRASSRLWSGHFTAAKILKNKSYKLHIFSGFEKTYQAWYGVPSQYINDHVLRTHNEAGTEKGGSPYHNQIDHYSQTHFQFLYQHRITDAWNLQNTFHYTPGKGYYEEYKGAQDLSKYIAGSTETDNLVRRKNLLNHYYGSIHTLDHHGKSLITSLGAGWNIYNGGHKGDILYLDKLNAPVPIRYYDLQARKISGMLYGKMETKKLFPFTFSADLQYRTIKYQYQPYTDGVAILDHRYQNQAIHHFVNPKLGLSVQITKSLQIYASSGLAGREPNRDDYVKSDARIPLAEKLWDQEAGIRFKTAHFNWEQNFYFMNYKNQLIPTGKLNEVGAYIRINTPSSYRAGVETSLNFMPSSIISLTANLNLSQNKIRSFDEYLDNWDTYVQDIIHHKNTDISFSPGIIANLTADLTVFNKASIEKKHSIILSLQSQHIGKQYLDNTENKFSKLSSYTTIQPGIRYTLHKKEKPMLDLRFQLINLMNTKYESNGWVYRFNSPSYNPVPDDPYANHESGSIYSLKGFFPQAGRHFQLNMRIGI